MFKFYEIFNSEFLTLLCVSTPKAKGAAGRGPGQTSGGVPAAAVGGPAERGPGRGPPSRCASGTSTRGSSEGRATVRPAQGTHRDAVCVGCSSERFLSISLSSAMPFLLRVRFCCCFGDSGVGSWLCPSFKRSRSRQSDPDTYTKLISSYIAPPRMLLVLNTFK